MGHALQIRCNCSQAFAGGRERAADVFIAVGGRNEQSLKLRGRQEHPTPEHFVKKGGETTRVGLLRGRVIRYRLRSEKERDQ